MGRNNKSVCAQKENNLLRQNNAHDTQKELLKLADEVDITDQNNFLFYN